MIGRSTSSTKRFLQAAVMAAVLSVLGHAETVVTLTSGQRITGTLVDADAKVARIRDSRGIVEEIPLTQVTSIQFADSGATPEIGSPQVTIPPSQEQFCSIVAAYRAATLHPSTGQNPIAQAQAKTNSADPLSYEPQVADAFGPNAKFEKWVGTITFGVFNQSVVVRFVPDCPEAVDIVDFANASQRPFLPATTAATVIPLNSPLAKQLSTVPTKVRVTASGNLVPMPADPSFPRAWYKPQQHAKFVNNASGPATGATVAQPHYLAHFSDIRPLSDTPAGAQR